MIVKKISKLVSLLLVICIIAASMSIGASAAELLVKYNNSETYTVTIPEYIQAVAKDTEPVKYDVTAADILISPYTELTVSVEYNSLLMHKQDPGVSLGYDMYTEQSGEEKTLTSGGVVLKVAAGSVTGDTSQIWAKLTSDVLYSGMYVDTAVFTIDVSVANNIEELQDKHKFEYYSTLSGAVSDVNAGTVGDNADADREDAVAGIYTDEDGKVSVVLLQDAHENSGVVTEKDMTLVLGGNKFSTDDIYVIKIDNGDLTIDGRIPESCLYLNTSGAVTRTITGSATAGTLTILGGSYINDTTATSSSSVVSTGGKTVIKDASIEIKDKGAGHVYAIWSPPLSTASLSVKNTDIKVFSETASQVYAFTVQCPSAEISSSNITCEGGGDWTIGIYNESNAVVSDTTISCEGTGRNTFGIQNKKHAIVSGCNIIASSPYEGTSDSKDYLLSSEGIHNNAGADLQLFNCKVKGTHSGVASNGVLYVNGGTYAGYAHGGFYFSGSGTENDNVKDYIENATIEECEWFGKYEHDDATAHGAVSNHAACYIGGGTGDNYISVCMNNCVINATRWSAVLRGTSGEHDLSLYISNSSINSGSKIRIDKATDKLFIGYGNNFGSEICDKVVGDNVIFTGEVYTKSA